MSNPSDLTPHENYLHNYRRIVAEIEERNEVLKEMRKNEVKRIGRKSKGSVTLEEYEFYANNRENSLNRSNY